MISDRWKSYEPADDARLQRMRHGIVGTRLRVWMGKQLEILGAEWLGPGYCSPVPRESGSHVPESERGHSVRHVDAELRDGVCLRCAGSRWRRAKGHRHP